MLKKRIQRMEAVAKRCVRADTSCLTAASKIRKPKDLLNLLDEQIDAIRATPWAGPMQKAQAIGVLAGIARKVLDDHTISARIEMLEAVLKARSQQT